MGEVPTKPAGSDPQFRQLLNYAQQFASTEVRAVAHSYADAVQSYELQGSGVGLFRTADMFAAPECLTPFRLFLLSEDHSERMKLLSQLLQAHQAKFVEVFHATHCGSLTMCLLDVPLHSFFPPRDDPDFDSLLLRLSVTLCIEVEECAARVAALSGVEELRCDRGSKAAVLHPTLITMQTMAFIGEFSLFE